MDNRIFSLSSWPRAIVHLDADAFFTSCEEAIHPELRGKPIATGAERGIISCASYPAKACGVKRGVPIHEARRRCPSLLILPSDYETYSLFSRRLFATTRRFTPQVEEYSIDEAFADITGLRRVLHQSYEEIAVAIREEILTATGISVSIGLSLSKVLAKIASKYRKPAGITIIPGRKIARYLEDLPIESVWGIGSTTAQYLRKLGVLTALDFARLPEAMVRERLTKPLLTIWHELRGESVLPVITEEKASYASISKTHTFTPPSRDEEYLYAQLMRNLESACIKARRYQLAATGLLTFLKRQDFEIRAVEAKLSRPSSYPLEITPILREQLTTLYHPSFLYRATGVVLLQLHPESQTSYSLFEDPLRAEKTRLLYQAVDAINGKYGKHTVHLGASHPLEERGKGKRGEPTAREATRLRGESKRKHLGLPLLHVKT